MRHNRLNPSRAEDVLADWCSQVPMIYSRRVNCWGVFPPFLNSALVRTVVNREKPLNNEVLGAPGGTDNILGGCLRQLTQLGHGHL